MNGVIKKLNQEKQYGFILGDDNEQYFFHRQSLVNRTDWPECEVGRNVTFEPDSEAPKGPRAENIMVL